MNPGRGRTGAGSAGGAPSVARRSAVLAALFCLLFGAIGLRLFQLQILRGEQYSQRAYAQHTIVENIPAKRGEILVREEGSETLVKMATNTTLDLVFVDPSQTPDRAKVAAFLAKLLYTAERHAACEALPEDCPEGSVKIITPELPPAAETTGDAPPTPYQAVRLQAPSFLEARDAYETELFLQINRDEVDFVPLARGITDTVLAQVESLGLAGVDVSWASGLVYADPTQIQSPRATSRELAAVLEDASAQQMEQQLQRRTLQYVMVARRLSPAQSAAIRAQKANDPYTFGGVGLSSEEWRYYPEGELAGQILGFVSQNGRGRYGVEGKLDAVLRGEDGVVERRNDVLLRGVSLDEGKLRPALDGADVVLTISRLAQHKAEQLLAEYVPKFRADSGQIIVMKPQTGEIVAMAQYPSFDPNRFGSAFLLRRTRPQDRETIFRTTPIFAKDDFGRYRTADLAEYEAAWEQRDDPEFYIYRNVLGPGVFQNRSVQTVYEPGSVIKPLTMAVGVEVGEVTPETTFEEDGPIEVGDFEIKNAFDQYRGTQNMREALEQSSNVGLARVALSLGKSVLHNFFRERFSFGLHTDIELADEAAGTMLPRLKWSDAHLITAGFGQGFSVNALQTAQAFSTLANGGLLLRPRMVAEIRDIDGTATKAQTEMIRRVISPDTARVITGMLVSVVENGMAWRAAVPGVRVAGKTGTSQIAGADGRYESEGDGIYITSFVGYAPAERPEYLVLVRFDRPRLGERGAFGSNTAAPVFSQMMGFLVGNSDPGG